MALDNEEVIVDSAGIWVAEVHGRNGPRNRVRRVAVEKFNRSRAQKYFDFGAKTGLFSYIIGV